MKTLQQRIEEKMKKVANLNKEIEGLKKIGLLNAVDELKEELDNEIEKLKILRRRDADKFWINKVSKMDINKIKNIQLPNPLRKIHYDILYDIGVLRKEQLIDGEYYEGFCRNADVAMWDEKENCFWYMRHKFGSVFAEKINHLQDDNFYDLFIPIRRVIPKDDEKIY